MSEKFLNDTSINTYRNVEFVQNSTNRAILAKISVLLNDSSCFCLRYFADVIERGSGQYFSPAEFSSRF